MKTTYHYLGMEKPRMQICVFCGISYDALYGPPRPHAVCAGCWPEIHQAEVEYRRNKEKEDQ